LLDKVEIKVIAGGGGNGAVSFRREKFVPLGGPDGGDGGIGGDVVIKTDKNITNLNHYRHKKIYRAGNGANGRGQKKRGKSGEDLVLTVPVGTVVSARNVIGDDSEVYDLAQDEQRVVVAGGGRGGLGNVHFASSTNQSPQIAQKGEAGEEKELILELKLIADVGIIGYPNAGKSSLLAAASAAKPRIAGYPFTTLEPELGVVDVGNHSFVLAEIPGLIAGAHLGKGLGHDFLRHVMRTKILIHLLDGTSSSPVGDMIKTNTELALFDSALAKEPQLVAVNKIDLPAAGARKDALAEEFSTLNIDPLFISALTGEGIPELMAEVAGMLKDVEEQGERAEEVPVKVFRPTPKGENTSVSRDGDVFVVHSPGLERVIEGSDASDAEARRQLLHQVGRAAVVRALQKAGARVGDRIRCGTFEWRF